MKYLVAWLVISLLLFIWLALKGKNKSFDALAKKKGYIKADEILKLTSDIEKKYEALLEIQRNDHKAQIDEINKRILEDVLQDIEKSNNPGNPFGSHLFPLVKISSLYSIQDQIDQQHAAGKMTEESYKIKRKWIANEIARKVGSPYYDDTSINIDFNETE